MTSTATEPYAVRERVRARILYDTDPAVVAEAARRKAEWAARIGHPKRCKVGEVHPWLGCCLYCGAEMGEFCKL